MKKRRKKLMKVSDFLKKLGIDIDDDIDDTKTETSESDSKSKNEEEVESNDKPDSNDDLAVDEKNDTEDVKTMEIKFDENTGLFDLSNIEDESVKSVLKKANDTVKKTANQVKIDKAVDAKLASLKLNDGITTSAVRKLADLSGVKIDGDGNITGIDEAFDSLAKEQSGLFKVENKETGSNPIMEGFNPQGAIQQGVVPNSFSEAFSMME